MSSRKHDYDRVELVWPGKRAEVERVRLPFQVIERVNDVRRSRGGHAPMLGGTDELPDWWPEGWRNKLIWGDNKYIMSSLLDEFSGKVDLIYIDPPFDTGDDFTYRMEVGDEDVTKLRSIVEEVAYRDTWGLGASSYLGMLYERLILAKELLAHDGSIFVHVDWHVSHYVRLLLDDIFGSRRFRNEIVWWYYNKFQGNVNHFARNHDSILYYTKSERFHFEPQREEREQPVRQLKREWNADKGSIVNVKDEEGHVMYQDVTDRRVDDVWRMPMLQPADRTENTGFRTQKRKTVIARAITAASEPGDIIADFFAGSGTTLVAAEEAGRRWIGTDLGRFAIQTTRKRLLGVPGCRPFEVLNLGRYERRYWQGIEAGETLHEYYRFILELYGAQPIAGFRHLHGERGGRFVHVGATDSPVTMDELERTLEECTANGLTAVDVLGWEWEMGLNPSGKEGLAARYRVDVRLFHIPREVMEKSAVEAGDVHFFELSIVEVKASIDKAEVEIELTEFLPAVNDHMHEKVSGKVTKWSDWIDYWAIDFAFDGETFVNQWQAYRTRKNPTLTLRSDPHEYGEAGEHHVVVKVIDIFGNDTTHELRVNVGL